jgi:hypothetical protein
VEHMKFRGYSSRSVERELQFRIHNSVGRRQFDGGVRWPHELLCDISLPQKRSKGWRRNRLQGQRQGIASPSSALRDYFTVLSV